MKKSLVLLSIMSLAPSAFSQGHNARDIRNVNKACSKVSNDGNEHSYKACSDGVVAAKIMIDKYAQRSAKYIGCVDAYSTGIRDGFVEGRVQSSSTISDANTFSLRADMQSAISRSTNRANSKAETESAHSIISRYRKVVGLKNSDGSQVLPDKTPNMPVINFDGYHNGYEYDIKAGSISGISFRKVIDKGYVSKSSPFREKVAAMQVDRLRRDYAQNLCDIRGTIFRENGMNDISLWSLFKSQGTVDLKRYKLRSADLGWKVFNQSKKDIPHTRSLEAIKNLKKTVVAKTPIIQERLKRDEAGKVIPKLNKEGMPVVDANGHQVYVTEKVTTGYKTEKKRVKLSDAEAKEVRAVYEKSFKKTYSQYFERKHSSLRHREKSFSRNYGTARTIGLSIGDEVAFQTAAKKAYNERYRSSSRSNYAQLAQKIYLNSFNRLLGIFESNPVVELVDGFIVGNTNDNIYRPGEYISGDFTVQNLGEVSRPVTISLRNSQDIIANASGYTFSPAALDNTSIQTSTLGQISNDGSAREYVTVNMSLSNPSSLSEVGSAMTTSKSQGITLRDYAEVESASASLDILDGKLEVTTKIINPSTVETPALPVVTISAKDQLQTKNMYKIAPESEATVMVTFEGLDPLKLIRDRGINGSVKVKLGNKITHTKTYSSRNHVNQDSLYAQYFNNVVNGSATNLGGKSKAERLKDLFSIIEKRVQYGISGIRTSWKNQHEVDNTIVGDIQKVYAASKASGLVTKEVQQKYDSLASMLAKKVNNRGSERVRGLDKYYLRALKKFSKTLSTKARHHR